MPLAIHPEGQAIVEGRFGAEAYPHRINMVNLPAGSRLVPNPVNQMPGFSFGHLHCVPGFPSMAWPMVEWVLDTLYPELVVREPDTEEGFKKRQRPGGGVHEEVVRQVLQSQAQTVMLLIAGFCRPAEHRGLR